jgi:hypothetical protein
MMVGCAARAPPTHPPQWDSAVLAGHGVGTPTRGALWARCQGVSGLTLARAMGGPPPASCAADPHDVARQGPHFAAPWWRQPCWCAVAPAPGAVLACVLPCLASSMHSRDRRDAGASNKGRGGGRRRSCTSRLAPAQLARRLAVLWVSPRGRGALQAHWSAAPQQLCGLYWSRQDVNSTVFSCCDTSARARLPVRLCACLHACPVGCTGPVYISVAGWAAQLARPQGVVRCAGAGWGLQAPATLPASSLPGRAGRPPRPVCSGRQGRLNV